MRPFATLLLLFARSAVVSGEQFSTNVFTFNEGDWPCTRVPSIVLAGNATLLAFAECRDHTGDGCVPEHPIAAKQPKCVCMKRSLDGGTSWDAVPRCVAPAGSDQPQAVYHSATNTVVLHFNLGRWGVNSTVYQVTSSDNGEHWGAPRSLAAELGPNCASANAGPGRGVQLSAAAGPHAGRLVMVGWNRAYPDPHRHDCIWYSDSAGTEWQVSETVIPMMNEAQVAEAAGGAVYFNSRTRGNITGKPSEVRASSLSTNGGQSFDLPVQWNPTLTEPGQGCQGSVIGLPVADPQYLFFSNPGAKSRTEMTIRRSLDSGKTWPLKKVVHPGGSAYSCMTELPDKTQLGLLHERDAQGGGCKGPSCQTGECRVCRAHDVPALFMSDKRVSAYSV